MLLERLDHHDELRTITHCNPFSHLVSYGIFLIQSSSLVYQNGSCSGESVGKLSEDRNRSPFPALVKALA
jgi:hypothetical protein